MGRWNRARKQIRASGGEIGREIDVPLPLRGMYAEARTSELNGLFAAELLNMHSTGVDLESRKPYSENLTTATALQRVPYEFRGSSSYIVLKSTQAQIGAAFLNRTFDGRASVGYLSSQALMFDGLGEPIRYDGTTIQNAGFATDTATPAASLDGLVVHHDRVFAWDTDGPLEFFYGGLGAVTGTLTRFPLDRLGNITGSILGGVPLTVTASQTIEATLCLITSTGDIVVYRGLDPSDPQDWAIAARVKVAPPLSRFGFAQVGADVWMLSTSGLVTLRASLAQGRLALNSDISDPVSADILSRAKQGGRWQLHTAADGSAVIINHVLNETALQFIYATDGSGWSTANYPARFFHNLGQLTEFTSLTGYRCTLDQENTPADNIAMRWQSSWFRTPKAGGINHLLPTIRARGETTITVTVLSDHDELAGDIAEAQQTVILTPDEAGDGVEDVALNELFAVDAVGSVFQLTLEIEAPWARIVNMKANVS